MLKSKISDAVVLILAAGKSERMGKPKFLLKHPSGETFLQHLVASYLKTGIGEMVVVVNTTDFKNYHKHFEKLPNRVKVVRNPHPEKGRMYSVLLGSQAFSRSSPCFVQNIDNPFVETQLLVQLWLNLNQAEFIKPVYQGKGGHPILLSKKIIQSLPVDSIIFHDLRSLLSGYKEKKLEVTNKEVLLNVNNVSEYQSFIHSDLLLKK